MFCRVVYRMEILRTLGEGVFLLQRLQMFYCIVQFFWKEDPVFDLVLIDTLILLLNSIRNT
jgi:hypothetical protein